MSKNISETILERGAMMRVRVIGSWVVLIGTFCSGPCVWADAGSSGASPAIPSYTFRYESSDASQTAAVSVTGDFNGWSETANPMVRGSDGSYTTILPLEPGLHHYKFVLNGKAIADPKADKSLAINNGFGDEQSGVNTSQQNTGGHVFHYVPPAGAPDVDASVAGDFNGWSTTANPMIRGGDGSYSVTVALTPGSHHYKFVYDGKWLNDPGADKSLEADDGNGGKNSGLNFDPQASTNHAFRYVPPAGSPAVAVSVAGDFNGWSTTANPLSRGSDGSYSVTLDVSPRLHHYKLIIDNKWMIDPTADKSLQAYDGLGGNNSGFRTDSAAVSSTEPAAASN